jgi:putative transposase
MITHEGGKLRMLNISDEFTHECLVIGVSRRLKSIDVIDALADLFMRRGVARHIRSDHGPAFMAKAVQDWLAAVGASTAYIARGSPWANGFIERFNARRRDQLLDGAIFSSLRAAQIVIDSWRRHDHGVRPHAASAIRLPPRRWSCPHAPHGRLRHPDQRRRPCSHWRHDQP